nr:EamA family transporter [Paenibacillus sp. MMS18-CY102]
MIIVGGIVSVSNISLRSLRVTSLKAPLLALAVGICIAAYIVIDKLVLSEVPAVVLNESTNAANLLVLSWAAFRSREMGRELRSNWPIILLGGLLAPAGYLLFLFALKLAPVAQLAPIREIGTVFGTIMGIFILREQQGARRLFASTAITAGIIILGIWG